MWFPSSAQLDAYLSLLSDSTPTFVIWTMGFGVGWVALRPVSDESIVEWLMDNPRPAVVKGILKWSAIAGFANVVAIQVAVRIR
jgi:hypothetical protein